MNGLGTVGKFPARLVAVLVVLGAVASAHSVRAESLPPSEPVAETLELSAGAHATPEIPALSPEGYAVLPFANRSGVEGLGWMSAGVPAIIAEKLDVHPALQRRMPATMLPEGMAPPVDERAEQALAASLGQAEGARWVFGGHVRRPNWTFELSLRLWRVDAGVATLVDQSLGVGEFTDYSPMIDRALRHLLDKAGRPVPAGATERLARVPSKDFYAFTLYGRALSLMHGLGKKVHSDTGADTLKRVVFIDPKFAEAHRLLAVVYHAANQKAKARGQYRWAIELRPDFHAALSGLIRLSRDDREGDETLALTRRALELRPDDLALRLLHGELLWEAGHGELAHQELTRLLAVRPKDVNARRLMVLIHASKADHAQLVKELETLVGLEPSDVLARLDLAAAYRRTGRDADAISAYEAVITQEPKHLQALKFLGDLYKARKDMPRAIAMYERALASNQRDPRPYFLLGEAYSQVGNIKAAERVYLRAQRFPKYVADAYNMLGAVYYKRGEFTNALWYLRKAARARPHNASVRYNLGLALSSSGHTDAALLELRRAADIDPDDADIRYAQGVVLLRLGKLEAAEAAFKDALVRAGEHGDALANLKLIADLRKRATEGEASVD